MSNTTYVSSKLLTRDSLMIVTVTEDHLKTTKCYVINETTLVIIKTQKKVCEHVIYLREYQ